MNDVLATLFIDASYREVIEKLLEFEQTLIAFGYSYGDPEGLRLVKPEQGWIPVKDLASWNAAIDPFNQAILENSRTKFEPTDFLGIALSGLGQETLVTVFDFGNWCGKKVGQISLLSPNSEWLAIGDVFVTVRVTPGPKYTPLHLLGYIYTSFAHLTDGEVSYEEFLAIARKLHEWCPHAPEDDHEKLYNEVLEWYNISLNDRSSILKRIFAELDELDGFGKEQRIAFLRDLVDIALADGHLHDAERGWINMLAEQWDIEFRV